MMVKHILEVIKYILVFVRNGKNRSCNEFIPISVSNDPKILDLMIILITPQRNSYEI